MALVSAVPGQLELEEQPFELRKCVEQAIDLVAPKAAEKDIELAYQVDEQVPSFVRGDVTRLRQVLVNLLGNAVKFTEEGEVFTRVNLTQVDAGKDGEDALQLEFAVEDTGIGIPEDRLDRLFESFSQVDSSTTRKYGGTGLGLTISKRLVELMGGDIDVESTEGVGSVFSFTIAVAPADGPDRAYLSGEQPHLEGRRVLIVDDNATNRRILQVLTSRWGMHPYEASSGPEALGQLEQYGGVDVALLDMQMPGMDGLTLARRIRQAHSADDVPLVMISSMGQDLHAQDRDALFAATMTKPLKPARLFQVLATLFSDQTDAASGEDSALDAKLGQRHPLRILVAEDNLVNQKVIQRTLQGLGYDSDLVANGHEVLDALRRQPYDVVLMDIQMPELDGLEATRRIHADSSFHPRPAIIALTAGATQEDRAECLKAGMEAYVTKPVHIGELVPVLEAVDPVGLGAAPLS